MSLYQRTAFSAIVSRIDPREPLPAELEGILTNGRAPAHTNLHQAPANPASPGDHGNHNLPSFTVHEPALGRNVLPPISIDVAASVIQDAADITVTQLFWNDSNSIMKEAAYTFPLPTGCTVTDFTCQIGHSKALKCEIKPKEEAREVFREYINNHSTGAALLEQDTEEIFTTSLGNLPSKTKIKITVTYITLLKHHFADNKGTTTLTVPACIANRYGDKPQDYNDAASTTVPQGLTLQVEVTESNKILSITSPTHNVSIENQLGASRAESFADLAGDGGCSHVETALVRLVARSTSLDRDFVLDIISKPNDDTELPQAWLEKHPTLSNHQALMLTIPSGFTIRTSTPVEKSEVLLLADLSGSMEDKIHALKASMQFFLKGIPLGRKFNIWCFGSSFKSWLQQSVEYQEASYESAASWVENNFRADMGGTELLPAVKAMVDARDKSLTTDFIILTDGETWRLNETLEYIHKTRDRTEGRVRFFALGIGKAVSHALVEGIAKAGGGYAEVIREAIEGSWEGRVVSMAEAALMTDHMGPLHMEVLIQDADGHGKASSLPESERSPADTSNLSPFNRNRIFYLFQTSSPSKNITIVTLKGDANGRTKSISIPVTVLEKKNTTIHRLAARSMLDDLERGQSHIHLGSSPPLPGSWHEISAVRKEGERIACKWSLVSKWTSFFLKEEPPRSSETEFPLLGESGILVADEFGDAEYGRSAGPVPGIFSDPGFSSQYNVDLDQRLIGGVTRPPNRAWSEISKAPGAMSGLLGTSDATISENLCEPALQAAGFPTDPLYGRGSYTGSSQLKEGVLRGTRNLWNRPAGRCLEKAPSSALTRERKVAVQWSRPYRELDWQTEAKRRAEMKNKLRAEVDVEQRRQAAMEPSAASKSGGPPDSASSPTPLTRGAGKSEPTCASLVFGLHGRPDSQKSESERALAETRNNRDTIRQLLAFQSPKGCFASNLVKSMQFGWWITVDVTLFDILGEKITQKISDILCAGDDGLFGRRESQETVIVTAVVCVAIQKSFSSESSLWALMVTKAKSFLKQSVPELDKVLTEVETALGDMRIETYRPHEAGKNYRSATSRDSYQDVASYGSDSRDTGVSSKSEHEKRRLRTSGDPVRVPENGDTQQNSSSSKYESESTTYEQSMENHSANADERQKEGGNSTRSSMAHSQTSHTVSGRGKEKRESKGSKRTNHSEASINDGIRDVESPSSGHGNRNTVRASKTTKRSDVLEDGDEVSTSTSLENARGKDSEVTWGTQEYEKRAKTRKKEDTKSWGVKIFRGLFGKK